VPEALIFDLDGTLYRQAGLRRAMLLRLVRAHAWRPVRGWRTARILGAYRRAQESLRDSSLVTDDLGAAQLRWTCERLKSDPIDISECVTLWMEREPLAILGRYLYSDLIDFLEACRGQGLRLGLFSDYPAEAKLEALRVRGFFEVVLTAQSPEVGAFKPNPRGLLAVARALDVHPADCLYIGDRPEVDAAAARAAGMACCIIGRERSGRGGEWTPVASYAELGRHLLPAAADRSRAAQPSLDRR
jgi:HAD superfamily hydrolase (TIGR01549 family)